MKKLLVVLVAGLSLAACSHDAGSASANASATEASAPAAAASAPAVEASAPEASAPVVEDQKPKCLVIRSTFPSSLLVTSTLVSRPPLATCCSSSVVSPSVRW